MRITNEEEKLKSVLRFIPHKNSISNMTNQNHLSSLLHELLAGSVGIGSPSAAPAAAISDLQVGGSTVDVVLAEGRRSGHVVRAEHVCFLPCFMGESLLGEALVLHQVGVATVFSPMR